MKILQLHPQIYLCEGEDANDLNDSMMRIQEFYESKYDTIRGHYFTVSQFKKLYKQDNKGKYTYNEDWVGNNIPGEAIREFFTIFKHSTLTSFEKKLKAHLTKAKLLGDSSRKFYLIGIIQHHIYTLTHELAHAFFYIYPHYKKKMTQYLTHLDPETKKKAFKILSDVYGYHKSVLLDELHAYICTETTYWMCDRFKLKPVEMNWAMVHNMQRHFSDYRLKVEYLLDNSM